MANDEIESLIKQSARDAVNLLNGESSSCRLIYPKGNKNERRCSEQELKQIFIENVCKDGRFYYSVETPSEFAYNFKDKSNPQIFFNETKTQEKSSSRIDLTLYENGDNNAPKYHIEFKNGQAEKSSIKKDMLKMAFEPSKGNYFFHIIVTGGNDTNSSTQDALYGKFSESYQYAKKNAKKKENENRTVNDVTVYILFVNAGKNSILEKHTFSKEKLEWTDSTKIVIPRADAECKTS